MSYDNGKPPPVKKNRRLFLLMVVLFGLPYVFAWGFMQFREELPLPDTSNNGDLITPVRSLAGIPVETLDGSPANTDQWQGKWILLTVHPSSCDQACQKNLYHLRQIRRAVGADDRRVERLMLATDRNNLAGLKEILPEYQGTRVITGPDHSVQRITDLLKHPNDVVEGGVYLIDPLGNFMMSYRPDIEPKLILEDLERLLEVSTIG